MSWLMRLIDSLFDTISTYTDIGSLLGGKDKLSGQIDIATDQSLVSKNGRDINAAIENYG